MRVIIAGGRNFNDFELMKSELDKCLPIGKVAIQVISGTANGADKLGERYSELRNFGPIAKFVPDWNKHGKRAGFIRNEAMAIWATHLVAFWDGKSKGTRHMIETAKRYELVIKVIRY